LDISSYVENANNNGVGISISNFGNVHIHGMEVQMNGAAATAINIAETGTNLTKNVMLDGVRITGATVVGVNNTVTTETFGTSTEYLGYWSWQGDNGTGQDALAAQISTGGTNVIQDGIVLGKKLATSNRSTELVVVPSSSSRKFALYRNYADNTTNGVLCDVGSAAPQECQWDFSDRGTAQWRFRKASGNQFIIQDQVAGLARATFTLNSTTQFGAGATQYVSVNELVNHGTGGFRVYSGGATPVLWWYANNTGFHQRDATGVNDVFSVDQTGATTIAGATPAGGAGFLGIGNTSGFGTGGAGVPVTTTALGGGTGPATPQTVVKYLKVTIGGTVYWAPLVQ
jgi:hypothetical protein